MDRHMEMELIGLCMYIWVGNVMIIVLFHSSPCLPLSLSFTFPSLSLSCFYLFTPMLIYITISHHDIIYMFLLMISHIILHNTWINTISLTIHSYIHTQHPSHG